MAAPFLKSGEGDVYAAAYALYHRFCRGLRLGHGAALAEKPISADFVCAVRGDTVRRLAAAVAAQNGNALPLLNFKGKPLQEVFTDHKKLC